MKRILHFLLLSVLIQGIVSCSRKHKVNRLDKQRIEYQQKSQSQKIRALQSAVWDTNTFEYQNKQFHYQLWDLKGEVRLLPNGGLQAQEAKVYSWSTEKVTLNEDNSQVRTTNILEEKIETKEEHLSQTSKSKSKSKSKRKINPSWGFAILLVLIGIVFWRKRSRA